jgi:uncharacterized protein (TIGR01777 family)
LKVAITGSSGFIGSLLSISLEDAGHSVSRLVRRHPDSQSNEIYWNPTTNHIDKHSLEGFDAIVNLSGKNLSERRWSKRQKGLLHDSRVHSTELLSHVLAGLNRPPQVLISASAIGYYGDRADELLTETSPAGGGFLAQLCQDWERAADSAKVAGIRVVVIRTGLVIGRGGLLQTLLPIFKFGLGGIFGSGQQYMSWINAQDAVSAILHLINSSNIEGPVNIVSANPVTNREFTNTLGRILHRPTIMWIPSWLARLVRGQMAEEMVLASTRVRPTVLLKNGFEFQFPLLDNALRDALEIHNYKISS